MMGATDVDRELARAELARAELARAELARAELARARGMLAFLRDEPCFFDGPHADAWHAGWAEAEERYVVYDDDRANERGAAWKRLCEAAPEEYAAYADLFQFRGTAKRGISCAFCNADVPHADLRSHMLSCEKHPLGAARAALRGILPYIPIHVRGESLEASQRWMAALDAVARAVGEDIVWNAERAAARDEIAAAAAARSEVDGAADAIAAAAESIASRTPIEAVACADFDALRSALAAYRGLKPTK